MEWIQTTRLALNFGALLHPSRDNPDQVLSEDVLRPGNPS